MTLQFCVAYYLLQFGLSIYLEKCKHHVIGYHVCCRRRDLVFSSTVIVNISTLQKNPPKNMSILGVKTSYIFFHHKALNTVCMGKCHANSFQHKLKTGKSLKNNIHSENQIVWYFSQLFTSKPKRILLYSLLQRRPNRCVSS